jgi:hypothetical protein
MNDDGRRLGERLLLEAPAISERVLRWASEAPGYTTVDVQTIKDSNEAGVRAAIEAVFLSDRHIADEVAVWPTETLGEREGLGIPLETMMRATHRVALEIWLQAASIAEELGIEGEALTGPAGRLLEFEYGFLSAIATVWQRKQTQAAQLDQARRDRFLSGVLGGSFSSAEITAEAPILGIAVASHYRPFRARRQHSDDAAILRLQEHFSSAGALVSLVDADVAGISDRDLPAPEPDVTVGVGPVVRITDLAGAFESATQALEVASSFGLRGEHSVEELGLLPAILAEMGVGETLVARYLDPLSALGRFGLELEYTLRVLFANDLRMDATATALVVHPNSLRYRLRRYERLTGADLGKVKDLVQIWWALHRKTMNELQD